MSKYTTNKGKLQASRGDELLQAALRYASRGWPVFPLHTPTKAGGCSCRKTNCESQGKHPRTQHGLLDATMDEAQIREWWQMWPDANIGLVTGAQAGLVVLDVDGPEGERSLRGRFMPPTPCVKTGKGQHYLFAYPGLDIRNFAKKLPGLDLRGDGGYVVAVPSLHHLGERYRWLISLEEVDLAPCPPWLLELVDKSKPSRSVASPVDGPIPAGARNATLASLAGSMQRRGMGQQAILAALLVVNQDRCEPPLSRDEVERIAGSIAQYPPGDPSASAGKTQGAGAPNDAPWFTETGKFLPPILGDTLMGREHFINLSETLLGRLFVYQDGYYQAGGAPHLRKRVADTLGQKSLSRRFSEVLAWVETQSQRPRSEANEHGELINVANGMLNWRSSVLRPHSSDYLSTIRIPAKYDPEATCPRVSQFFREVLPPDCISTMLEFFGYALVPDTRFEKALMLTGSGANGKSRTIMLLAALVGQANVSNVALQALEDHRFALAQLEGKLVNASADLPSMALQSTDTFKKLVTGDGIQAEHKFQSPFTLFNKARLVFSANRVPRSWDTSNAFFRRWLIIPFPNTFEGDRNDTDLLSKLTTPQELSGLLNLALEGLRRLMERRRFDPPASAKNALAEYRLSSDPILAFLNECCTTEPEEGQRFARLLVGKTALYNAYVRFCEAQKLGKPDSTILFNRRFKELHPNAQERRPKGSDRMWDGGVRLLPDFAGGAYSQDALMEDPSGETDSDIPF